MTDTNKQMIKNEQLGTLMEIANGIMESEELHSLVTIDMLENKVQASVLAEVREDTAVMLVKVLLDVGDKMLDAIPADKIQLFGLEFPEKSLDILQTNQRIQRKIMGK